MDHPPYNPDSEDDFIPVTETGVEPVVSISAMKDAVWKSIVPAAVDAEVAAGSARNLSEEVDDLLHQARETITDTVRQLVARAAVLVDQLEAPVGVISEAVERGRAVHPLLAGSNNPDASAIEALADRMESAVDGMDHELALDTQVRRTLDILSELQRSLQEPARLCVRGLRANMQIFDRSEEVRGASARIPDEIDKFNRST